MHLPIELLPLKGLVFNGIILFSNQKQFGPAVARTNGSPCPNTRIRDVDDDGKVSEQVAFVRELGFAVGQAVMRKQDKIKGTIEAMAGDKITINVDDGPLTGRAHVSTEGFRLGHWKVLKTRPEPPLEVPDCSPYSALASQEFNMCVTKGQIFKILLDMEEKHKKVLAGVKMTLKPHRDIIALKAFPVGKLCLVPCSTKIETRDKLAAGSVSLGTINGTMFQLGSYFVGPDKDQNFDNAFLQPFWSVRVTHDPDKANVSIQPQLDLATDNSNFTIPVMRNIKELAANDVLLRYVQKDKPEVQVEPLVPEPKRRRTAKGS